MPTTITEIAKKANVSKGLVSRFINGDPTLRISEETRDRIHSAQQELGGVEVNRFARGLRKSLSYNIVFPVNENIAIECTETGEITTSPIVKSLRTFLKSKGFRLSFNYFTSNELYEEISDFVKSPHYCDGLFLQYGVVDDTVSRIIGEKEFPHVCCDPRGELFGINTVTAHLEGAYRQAIGHLRELGHERIGYVGPIGPVQQKIYRYPAFAGVLAENQMPNDPKFNCDLPAFRGGHPPNEEWIVKAKVLLRQWFARSPRATAVICKNDYIALVFIEVMRELGLTPGKEISVIGYDNVETRSSTPIKNPILTTIENPQEDIGRRCGELLLMQVLHKYSGIVYERVPVQLIIRETTGPCKKQ